MPLISRRGLTLLEVLVGLVLLGLLGLVLSRSSLRLARATTALLARSAAQQTMEESGAWLLSELSQVGHGDLRQTAADRVRYRGFRGAGLACRVTADEILLPVDRWSAWRDPQPGRDSLLLYTGGLADSTWVAQPLLAVGGTSCDGRPALRLTTVTDSSTLARRAPGTLLPVRLFEGMETRLYPSAGSWWLGARSESAAEAIQPLAGPYAAGGVAFGFRDAGGVATLLPDQVRQVSVQLVTSTPAIDSARFGLAPANLTP